MASVRRDPRNGQWRVTAYAGIDPLTGKKRQLSERLPADASEAEIAAAVARLDAEAAFLRETGRVLTLDGLVEWYIEDHKGIYLAPGTKKSYRSRYRKHISPRRGSMPAEKVMPYMIAIDLDALVRGDGCDPISPRTANGIIALLNAVYGAARANRLVSHNPVDDIDRIPVPPGETAKAFSLDELAALLEWAADVELEPAGKVSEGRWEDSMLKAAVMLAVSTGLRVGEVCALRACDLTRAGSLRVRCSASDAGGLHAGAPKSRKARVVSLDGQTAELLGRLAACAPPPRSGKLFGPWLFPRHDGRLRPTKKLSQPFRATCSALGLGPDRRFHELRHTHATLLLEQGTSVKVVSERLGHSSETVTLERYSHLLPGLDESAAEGFGELSRALRERGRR